MTLRQSHDVKIPNISPGRVIDQMANRIASLKTKLGNATRKEVRGALTGRKRLFQERVEELESLAADLGTDFRRKVEERVNLLLKDDD